MSSSAHVTSKLLLQLEEYYRLIEFRNECVALKAENAKLKDKLFQLELKYKTSTEGQRKESEPKKVDKIDHEKDSVKNDSEDPQFGSGQAVAERSEVPQAVESDVQPKRVIVEEEAATVSVPENQAVQSSNVSEFTFNKIKVQLRYKKLAHDLFRKLLQSDTVTWNGEGIVKLPGYETKMNIKDLLPLMFYPTTAYVEGSNAIYHFAVNLIDLGFGRYISNKRLLIDYNIWYYLGKDV